MRGHVLIAAVDTLLVTTCSRDAGLEIVADDLTRHAAELGKCVHVAADLVRQRLRSARLGIGEVRSTKGCHKDLCPVHLARGGVDHLYCLPGIIKEKPFTGWMDLPP